MKNYFKNTSISALPFTFLLINEELSLIHEKRK